MENNPFEFWIMWLIKAELFVFIRFLGKTLYTRIAKTNDEIYAAITQI